MQNNNPVGGGGLRGCIYFISIDKLQLPIKASQNPRGEARMVDKLLRNK